MPETDKEKEAKKTATRPVKIKVDPNMPKPNITKKTGYAESSASTKDTPFQMYENPDYLIQNKVRRTGYWNAFQDYLKDYKLPTGESYIGNVSANRNLANDYTGRAIADYNKSLLEKYKDKPEVAKKMAINLDDVAQVQEYYRQGDPRVIVDRIVGGKTSQFRFPSAALVDVDKAREGEFIPVMYGGKQYVLPAESYNRGATSQDYIKYDPSVHQNINPNYVTTLNMIRGGQAGGAFVVPERESTNITPVTSGTANANAATTAQGVTAPQGAITAPRTATTPSTSNKAMKPVAPRMITSPTGEIIYEGMDDPKYDAIKKENARKRAMSTETTAPAEKLPTEGPVEIKGNFAKGGKVMAPKMKKYAEAGVVQVSGSQGQTNTSNVPLTQEQINAKKAKNDALVSQLGSAAMTIGNQLNQQPIDYSASEKQRQTADVASLAANQALSAAVPYYGAIKGATDILGSMTAKDKYGEAKPGINAVISEMTTNPVESVIKEASKGNALGALREASGWGKIGRVGMQLIGKGDETKGFFGGVNKALGTTDRKKAGEEYMAKQLAEAKAKDTAYKQSQAVANRDAGILEGAQVQGLYDLSSPEYDENRQLILKPGYAKGGVIGAAKMMYAKGGTIVGKGGPKDDAIFTKANKEGIEPGSFIVPAENNEKAKGIRAALFGDKNKVSKFKKGGEMESNVAVSNGEHLFTPKERKKIVNYLGEEILEELAPNAEENNESENDKAMGGVIERTDGSYSKRGLWDNIRDAAGSGKKPTTEMLKQEKKIKAEYYNGGIMSEGIVSQKRTEQIQDSYKSGGYVVQRSSDREGKTHKVTGPDGTVKYFGDPNLGQHPKDPARKEAFYARHKENLDNNPHFRAYARETWAEGGTTGTMMDRTNMREYKDGGLQGFINNDNGVAKRDKTSVVNSKSIYIPKELYQPNTPEEWGQQIRLVEQQIGRPDNWTMDSYNKIQNKLNEYKNWRENTEKGRDVVDYHNEPNEYVVPLPSHLLDKKANGGLTKSKAKIMLHEGMAQGKPITEQQRKYFGWVAGGSKQSKADGGDINGYAMGTDVEGVEDVPVSKKTYAELITPPLSWKGTKEQYKAAADKAIKEGKVIPKGSTATKNEVKSDVKAPPVKGGKKSKKSSDMTFEPMERRDVALEELRKMDEAQALGLQQSGEKSIMAKPIVYVNAAYPTPLTAPRKELADYVSRIDPGAAFSAYQIMQGSKLLRQGERPKDVSKIDPAWNAAVERAQREATFGYSPEQAAMLEQQRLNTLGDARFSGRNLAGGSAGTAFQQERQAINQGWANALQLKSADQQLRMQKQQYADQAVRERAAFLDTQRRRAFGDAMDTYNVNQESGSALVGAGVRNAIGAFRFQKELDAQERAAKIAGAPVYKD